MYFPAFPIQMNGDPFWNLSPHIHTHAHNQLARLNNLRNIHAYRQCTSINRLFVIVFGWIEIQLCSHRPFRTFKYIFCVFVCMEIVLNIYRFHSTTPFWKLNNFLLPLGYILSKRVYERNQSASVDRREKKTPVKQTDG